MKKELIIAAINKLEKTDKEATKMLERRTITQKT